MTPSAVQRAATEQAPTCLNKTENPPRDTEDILTAAYRMRAYGWTEAATVLALDHWRRLGIRKVGRHVRRMSDADLVRHLRGFESQASAQAHRQRRGDLLIIRSDPRWPWRTSTAQ